MKSNVNDDGRLRAAVLDDYQGFAMTAKELVPIRQVIDVDCFREHISDPDDLVDALAAFDIVVLMRERTPFPASIIRRLPRLRLLVTSGGQNAAIDIAAAEEAGIVVCGTRILTTPTVELTWALILALLRHIPQEDASVRGGEWQQRLGEGLEGQTLGLLGLGRIGGRVARVGRAFDMRVVAWSPNLKVERAADVGVTPVSLQDLLGEADVVSIHLRLGPRTVGLVGEGELQTMKPTSYLINTSRAEIIHQESLARALSQGWIAGAGLDVFDQEPLPANHFARELPNTILTPHIGYVVRQNYEIFFRDIAEDVTAFLTGKPVRIISP